MSYPNNYSYGQQYGGQQYGGQYDQSYGQPSYNAGPSYPPQQQYQHSNYQQSQQGQYPAYPSTGSSSSFGKQPVVDSNQLKQVFNAWDRDRSGYEITPMKKSTNTLL